MFGVLGEYVVDGGEGYVVCGVFEELYVECVFEFVDLVV